MNFEQPKPDSKKYSDLISDIEKGIIKIPKFQREFVWGIDKTAKLLDSILKGYPIGTFILWKTDERINDIKNVGNLDIPPTPDGTKVEYVLDGQQRITSLFAAYRGAKIQKIGEKKVTDYGDIVVLRKEDIDSAIEVFTRINTGGQTLTLFEIMSAKTYDEEQDFDMTVKWGHFIKELKDIKYEGVSNSVVLSLLSLILSRTKECKRKTILALDKQTIIDTWDGAISALKDSIDYFRTTYRIPVSQILPYDALLIPFGYFFYHQKDKPNGVQKKLLEEFFWRISLSFRYSSSTESKLAQDIKRIDTILDGNRPDYADIKVSLDSPRALVETSFSAGNSYCKAILCLLAYQEPKDFRDNGKVILDNSWLKIANSKNYHHFFPRAYLKAKEIPNGNSLMNITFVSDHLNKRKIGAKAPSVYIGDFHDENSEINIALKSHFIDLKGFGIESDDYATFLAKRSKLIYDALESRIDMTHQESMNEELEELILAGESDRLEFKSTLRYDLRTKEVNKKLEFVIAKTIAAFLNSEGGDLLIGIDDDSNALGLEDDLRTLEKQSIDGFELHLIGIINKYVGKQYGRHTKITFPIYDSQQICRIQVSRSGSPVFTIYEGKEEFFVRTGCSSQPLSRGEQSNYEREHWT